MGGAIALYLQTFRAYVSNGALSYARAIGKECRVKMDDKVG